MATITAADATAGATQASGHAGRSARTRSATDRKIMQATIDILASQGVGAVTIEEVARRSGVAKTTIYRRYSNADDLLHRMQIETAGAPDFSDLAPTRDGLLRALERIAANFDGTIGLKAVGVVLSSEDGHLQRMAGQILDPARRRFDDFVRRGQQAGAFAADVDTSFLFATILGSMMACTALHGDDAGAWPSRMTAVLWPTLTA
ncbi:TetR/AcrR family transcriptional regulator [Bifidobacterium leontopitheci]|nr:helix-turn-helix domain-containing protein [Bifidobacterium leontopitheci]